MRSCELKASVTSVTSPIRDYLLRYGTLVTDFVSAISCNGAMLLRHCVVTQCRGRHSVVDDTELGRVECDTRADCSR